MLPNSPTWVLESSPIDRLMASVLWFSLDVSQFIKCKLCAWKFLYTFHITEICLRVIFKEGKTNTILGFWQYECSAVFWLGFHFCMHFVFCLFFPAYVILLRKKSLVVLVGDSLFSTQLETILSMLFLQFHCFHHLLNIKIFLGRGEEIKLILKNHIVEGKKNSCTYNMICMSCKLLATVHERKKYREI